MTAQSCTLSASVEIVAGRYDIAERGSVSRCVRKKICFERVTEFSLPLLLKKEERAGERRIFLSVSPLSDSLPARSSRGERGRAPQAFACRTQLLCEPQRVESDRRAGCAKTRVAGKAPAGRGSALLWLRLRRAALYRRVARCEALGNSDVWDHPTPCRIQFGDTGD